MDGLMLDRRTRSVTENRISWRTLTVAQKHTLTPGPLPQPSGRGRQSKGATYSGPPCILSDKVHPWKKPGRGRPSPPESRETVGEQGRHVRRRQVRARTVVRADEA